MDWRLSTHASPFIYVAPAAESLDERPALRILALETSGRSGSVAALLDNNLLAQMELDPGERSAKALAPAVRQVLAQSGWPPRSIQLVAATLGPGSFTGLRIGVTTAKLLAYAAGAQCLGIDTLDVIAAQVPAELNCGRIVAAIDAGRGELFVKRFVRGAAGSWTPDGEIAIEAIGAWLERLMPDDAVTGPAIEMLADRLPAGVLVVESRLWQPVAATVGRLAALRYAAGDRGDAWKLAPIYIRRSAAEEKRDNSAIRSSRSPGSH